ncbi:MAG: AmmeMemoRadiSam system protein B [Kiritimatiellae bacterium]|nr:AmmeMemoRadiSam system protein B [Kiritimatiellia bacterium]
MMALASTIAGSWYPADESEIRRLADSWEQKASASSPNVAQTPNVLILPHAGWAYSGEIAWSAVGCVKGAKFSRVVLLAPSHRAWIENRMVAPESGAVSTPLGEIEIDRDFIDRLSFLAPVAKNDKVHLAEHATQIEYPLLQLALGGGFKIAPLVIGSLGADQMGMCARALARLMDERTLLVISSDFTHYGTDFDYTPYGTGGERDVRDKASAVDAEALSFIAKGDADGFAAHIRKTGATICGHVPIELALRSFPSGSSLACVKYATSGDADGDYTRFVCYAAAAGRVAWQGEKDAVLGGEARAYLLDVARKSLERAVRGGGSRFRATESDAHESVPPTVRMKMGAFVTLSDRTTGELRGCIGEIMPMRPLVEAVAARAVDSALHDPRFTPVTEKELAGIRVEVSALTPPKPVESWRDIVLGRDGMTLEKNGHFAVFLPQVAPEQGWDLETTLSYLSQKAGLSADAWREGAKFETFQAEVFHE